MSGDTGNGNRYGIILLGRQAQSGSNVMIAQTQVIDVRSHPRGRFGSHRRTEASVGLLMSARVAKAYNGSQQAYDWDQAKAIFKRQDKCANLPFIYLSAGVSDEIFRENLELAQVLRIRAQSVGRSVALVGERS